MLMSRALNSAPLHIQLGVLGVQAAVGVLLPVVRRMVSAFRVLPMLVLLKVSDLASLADRSSCRPALKPQVVVLAAAAAVCCNSAVLALARLTVAKARPV